MDPRVTVVMITRDRREETLATIARIRRLPEAPRLIVLDNGSSDGSARAIRRSFPGVAVVELEHNMGAAARNIGVLQATTPYVAFSDDDSWWDEGSLTRAADFLDAHPRVGLLNGRIQVGPEARLDPVCAKMIRDALSDDRDAPGIPIVGFVACGAVVRRTAFLEAGGFDSRFGVGGEEALLALDLLHDGWALRYVDEVVARHYPSPARDPGARRKRERRNALWVAWLRRPRAVALASTARLAREALHDGAARSALGEALAGLRWVAWRRRLVPPEIERLLRRTASAGD